MHWRLLERSIEFLIWDYLGATREVGECVTTNINASAKANILGSLTMLREADDDVRARVVHGLKCYGIARENRNILAHSSPGGVANEDHYIFRVAARQNGVSRTTFRVTAETLMQMAVEVENVQHFFLALHGYLRQGRTPPLPGEPVLPGKLHDISVYVKEEEVPRQPSPF